MSTNEYKRELSVKQFLNDPITNSDEFSNFFDWFCNESSLEKRMMSFVPKLRFLVKEGIVNADNTRVWFKNNCPCYGNLYDDMRIASKENDNSLGGFAPSLGYKNCKQLCEVWLLHEDEHGTETYSFETWNDFKKAVKTDKVLKQKLTTHFNR